MLSLLSLIGMADASYLTITHFTDSEVACSVIRGCEQVLTSRYSAYWGIPLAALGMAYYATLFLSAYYARSFGNANAWNFFRLTIGAGALISAGLVYLQLGVIGAVCQYCMVSAVLTFVMAAYTIIISRKKNEIRPIQEN
jgi:uncharacterized membrane protein